MTSVYSRKSNKHTKATINDYKFVTLKPVVQHIVLLFFLEIYEIILNFENILELLVLGRVSNSRQSGRVP